MLFRDTSTSMVNSHLLIGTLFLILQGTSYGEILSVLVFQELYFTRMTL